MFVAPLAAPAGPTTARLVVFPHAGAGPEPFLPLATALPGVEVVGVTLPGRGRRAAEAHLGHDELDVLPLRIAAEVAAYDPVPTVFYGHSMGGALAAVVAGVGAGLCDAVVVSASPPGADGLAIGPLAGPAGLRALLRRHRLPDDVLDHPERVTAARRTLAFDLRVARRLLLALDGTRLGVPLRTVHGRDDDLVPVRSARDWVRVAPDRFTSRVVDGGHWFPFLPAGRGYVVEEITAAFGSGPP